MTAYNLEDKKSKELKINRIKNIEMIDIKFFLLDDLIDENSKIKFYLPFDDFKTPPTFYNINDYLLYKKRVIDFIKQRSKRIENYIKTRK